MSLFTACSDDDEAPDYSKVIESEMTGNYKGTLTVTVEWVKLGAKYVEGFQLRYIYFIDKSYRKRLAVTEIPFFKIDELGAGMYKGEKVTQAERHAIKTRKYGIL